MIENNKRLKELANKAYMFASKKIDCLPCWPMSGGRSFSRYKVNKTFMRFLTLL